MSLLCVVLTLALLPMLTACNGGKDMSNSPYVGKWVATEASMSGLSMGLDTLFPGGFTFDIQKDGKVVLTIDGDSTNGTWSETDDGFNVDGEFDVVVDGTTGTIDYEGVVITFVKEGASTAASSSSESSAATEEQSGYGVVNGVCMCDTFQVGVPDGWSATDMEEDSVKLVNAPVDDDYDSFKDASLEIRIEDFSSVTGGVESSVENDKQFFEGKNPQTSEVVVDDVYKGTALVGTSAAFKGCTLVYMELEYAKDATSASKMQVVEAYYTDAQKADIDGILESMDITLLADGAGAGSGTAASDGGEVIEFSTATFTVPSGWDVASKNAISAEVENPAKFSNGSIEVSYMSKTSDAAAWADKQNGNYGGAGEVWTRDYNGLTFHGVTAPQGAGEVAFVDCGDGCVVKVSAKSIPLDQATEVLEGIAVK